MQTESNASGEKYDYRFRDNLAHEATQKITRARICVGGGSTALASF